MFYFGRAAGFFQPQVLFADIAGGKDRNERRGRGSPFDIRPAIRLLAFHETDGADDFKPKLASRFDGLHRRGTRGTYVVNDYHARALLAKSFDALAGAMRLFPFAYQEGVDEPAFVAGIRLDSPALYLLCGEHGDTHGDGIGAHGEPANGSGR